MHSAVNQPEKKPSNETIFSRRRTPALRPWLRLCLSRMVRKAWGRMAEGFPWCCGTQKLPSVSPSSCDILNSNTQVLIQVHLHLHMGPLSLFHSGGKYRASAKPQGMHRNARR